MILTGFPSVVTVEIDAVWTPDLDGKQVPAASVTVANGGTAVRFNVVRSRIDDFADQLRKAVQQAEVLLAEEQKRRAAASAKGAS